jgi:hypothetical protein
MALLNNTTGEYLKIISIHLDFGNNNNHFNYYIFRDLEQRQKYDAGLGEFEIFKTGQYNGINTIIEEINKSADNTLNIKNNLISAGYKALKNDMFNNWVDA